MEHGVYRLTKADAATADNLKKAKKINPEYTAIWAW